MGGVDSLIFIPVVLGRFHFTDYVIPSVALKLQREFIHPREIFK